MNYANRSWFATSQTSPAPLACDMVCETQRNIANGFFNVVTTTTLNGHSALELSRTGSSDTPWVDSTTYLPIQSVGLLQGGGNHKITFTWLVPDTTNLAQLVAPIPPGFTQVSGPPPEPAPAGGGVG